MINSGDEIGKIKKINVGRLCNLKLESVRKNNKKS